MPQLCVAASNSCASHSCSPLPTIPPSQTQRNPCLLLLLCCSEPGGGDGGVLQWLSSRQELLLLQEMGQLMARWQQYVMDRLLRGAAPALEQVRLPGQ